MSTLRFKLAGYLQPFANGQAEVQVEVDARTVSAALEALFKKHPGVADRVMNEQLALRQHVNVFVGSESIRSTGGMETPVPDDAVITILPAVSGG